MLHFAAIVKGDKTLELPEDARPFVQPGQVVDIELPDFAATLNLQPNYAMLDALEKIARRQEAREPSDGSLTLQFLHEGRDGDTYRCSGD